MELQTLLAEKRISKYQLSKMSGVPKSTIADICSGKSSLDRCSARTVKGIADALGCTMEEVLSLTPCDCDDRTGKPFDAGYLECGLPPYLQESIGQMKRGLEAASRKEPPYYHLDCDYALLASDINCAETDGEISEEQAWHLREKYLGMERRGGSL